MALNIIDFANLEDQVRYQIPVPPVYLLDTYPAFAAYSTRQLSSTATNCMIVTEDGTGTEAIIPFSADWVDEAAIATHCGASTGSVAQWYDQSGNDEHLVQATDIQQPEIYDGSTVIKENGKPAPDFPDGGTCCLVNTTLPSTAQPINIMSIAKYITNPVDTGQCLFRFDPNNFNIYYDFRTQSFPFASRLYSPSLLSSATVYKDLQTLHTLSVNSPNSIIRMNASQEVTGDSGSTSTGTGFILGACFTNGNNTLKGTIQEFIFYNSDQSANFAAIESDINTAFGVYA